MTLCRQWAVASDGASRRAALGCATACNLADLELYDAAALEMVKAGNADGVARVLGARSRYLSSEQQFEPALADALRSVVLMDASPETQDAQQAFALAARTVAAPFAQLEARGKSGPGLGLAREYTALARYWEPRERFATLDAGALRVLARTMGDRNRARPPTWRTQFCDPRDVEDARMRVRKPEPGAQVVVGLGCGRCGTSSLAALLKRYGAVTHESTLPDCRLVLWSDAEEAAGRRVDWWRKRGSALVGDVNYAHLPNARAYLDLGAKIVGLRRDKRDTVRSFAAWTEPGGALGSLAPRDHWRDHDASEFQYDDWDLTFPKYNAAPTKLDALEAYYDDYYARLAHLEDRSVCPVLASHLSQLRPDSSPRLPVARRLLEPRLAARVRSRVLKRVTVVQALRVPWHRRDAGPRHPPERQPGFV